MFHVAIVDSFHQLILTCQRKKNLTFNNCTRKRVEHKAPEFRLIIYFDDVNLLLSVRGHVPFPH